MNKRKTIVTTAAALATLTLSTLAFGSGIFEEVGYNIKFGPNDAQMQYPIYESEDRVYVSVRDMCDNLGIPIEWDEENREINVDMYNKKFLFRTRPNIRKKALSLTKRPLWPSEKLFWRSISANRWNTRRMTRYIILMLSFWNNITLGEWCSTLILRMEAVGL